MTKSSRGNHFTTPTFNNNSRGYPGGAIYGVNITVTNSKFTDNQGNPGGAIIGSKITVNNCEFTNNKASEGNDRASGGAIQGINITVTNSKFTNNKATTWGGAICVYSNGTLRLNSVTFKNNMVGNKYDAIHLLSGAKIYKNKVTISPTQAEIKDMQLRAFANSLTVKRGVIFKKDTQLNRDSFVGFWDGKNALIGSSSLKKDSNYTKAINKKISLKEMKPSNKIKNSLLSKIIKVLSKSHRSFCTNGYGIGAISNIGQDIAGNNFNSKNFKKDYIQTSLYGLYSEVNGSVSNRYVYKKSLNSPKKLNALFYISTPNFPNSKISHGAISIVVKHKGGNHIHGIQYSYKNNRFDSAYFTDAKGNRVSVKSINSLCSKLKKSYPNTKYFIATKKEAGALSDSSLKKIKIDAICY